VQQVLGHASAAMTLDQCGHLSGDRLDQVAEAMDAARAAGMHPLCARADEGVLEDPAEVGESCGPTIRGTRVPLLSVALHDSSARGLDRNGEGARTRPGRRHASSRRWNAPAGLREGPAGAFLTQVPTDVEHRGRPAIGLR
jgi:hypothetical protein